MLAKHVGKLAFGLAAMVVFTALQSQVASAQKIRSTAERRQHPGKGFWANQRASRNIQHARDYSRSIGQYVTEAESISPTVAKAESEALGSRIEAIQNELVIVRKENADSPEVLEQVKGIETTLNRAAETCAMLHAECCKDTINGQVCGDMAGKITATLDQVAKQHGKLKKSMGHVPQRAAKANKNK